jgi:hypothetical protein
MNVIFGSVLILQLKIMMDNLPMQKNKINIFILKKLKDFNQVILIFYMIDNLKRLNA